MVVKACLVNYPLLVALCVSPRRGWPPVPCTEGVLERVFARLFSRIVIRPRASLGVPMQFAPAALRLLRVCPFLRRQSTETIS